MVDVESVVKTQGKEGNRDSDPEEESKRKIIQCLNQQRREKGRIGGVLVTETGLFIMAHAAHLMEMIRPISKCVNRYG
jgi:hypothetical protein